MSDQFIGEIRYFTYMRGAPEGWLVCDGSVLSIATYQQLGTLLGTTYGGDGSSTFGLPDLRGRLAIGSGGGYTLGQQVGTETVTLNQNQLPVHNHLLEASTAGATGTDPTGQVFATGASGVQVYAVPTAGVTAMSGGMIGATGQGLPHQNCAPTVPLLACIASEGVWPQQNS